MPQTGICLERATYCTEHKQGWANGNNSYRYIHSSTQNGTQFFNDS